jgi:hypothetical protein
VRMGQVAAQKMFKNVTKPDYLLCSNNFRSATNTLSFHMVYYQSKSMERIYYNLAKSSLQT